jgi:hypothetical protein
MAPCSPLFQKSRDERENSVKKSDTEQKTSCRSSRLFFPIFILPILIPTIAATASPSIKRLNTIKEI